MMCDFCGFEHREGAKFCGNCGRPVAGGVVCRACSTMNLDANRYCDRCGHLLELAPESISREIATQTSSQRFVKRLPFIRVSRVSIVPYFQLLQERLAPYANFLVVAGVLSVVLAQGLFLFSEADPGPPGNGSLALGLGIILFAIGWSVRGDVQGSGELPRTVNRAICISATGRTFLAIGLAIAAMAILLYRLSTGSTSAVDLVPWTLAVVLAGIALIPKPRMHLPVSWRAHTFDVLVVVGIVTSFIIISSHDLQHWYYSAIGDEYTFYLHAKGIIADGIVRPFSQAGVYALHPVMSSIQQSVVMMIFGQNHFGWTFSSVLSIAISIPGIYLLAYTLGGRRAAVISTALFASSHYLLAFTHIGYNNLDALPPTVWAMGVYVLGRRKNSPLLLYCAGVIAGLGFYTFLAARIVLPILVLSTLVSRRRVREFVRLWPLGIGFVLAVIPSIVVNQSELISGMLGAVAGGYSEAVTGDVFERIKSNITTNVLAFNYSTNISHYVSGPLMDPITGLLAALGIGFGLGNARQGYLRLLLIWFLVAIVATGVLSPYPHVAVTRLFVVIPPLVILAGILADRLLQMLDTSGLLGWLKAKVPTILVSILIIVVFGLNVWQFRFVTPLVFHNTQEAVAIGALHSDTCVGDMAGSVIIGRHTEALLQLALRSYYPEGPLPEFLDHGELGERDIVTGEVRCIIFMNPDEPEARSSLADLINENPDGKIVSFSDKSGKASVQIFTPHSG